MAKLILMANFCFSSLVWAQVAPIGLINSFTGQVTVTHQDATKAIASIGLKLMMGDKVQAGEDSTAKILMHDGNVFTLNEKSELILKEYQAPGSKSGNATLELKGDLHSEIKNKYNDEDASFRVVMPAAVAGIRGTEFFIEQEMENVKITTFEGVVEVGSSMTGRKIENPVRVEKGFQVVSQSGKFENSGMKKMSPEELGHLKNKAQKVYHHENHKISEKAKKKR